MLFRLIIAQVNNRLKVLALLHRAKMPSVRRAIKRSLLVSPFCSSRLFQSLHFVAFRSSVRFVSFALLPHSPFLRSVGATLCPLRVSIENPSPFGYASLCPAPLYFCAVALVLRGFGSLPVGR